MPRTEIPTRQERLRYLHRRVEELAYLLEKAGRVDEAVAAARALEQDPTSMSPIWEEEWVLLLPAEKDDRLVALYLTLRAELVELVRDQPAAGADKKRRLAWLEGPAPKLVALASGAATLAFHGYNALHAAGLLAYEQDADMDDRPD